MSVVDRKFIFCCAALTLAICQSYTLSGVVYAFADQISPLARDFATTFEALVFIGLAVVATWKPKMLEGNYFYHITICVVVFGAIAVISGYEVSSIVLVFLGLSFIATGIALCSLIAKLSCLQGEPRFLAVCIVLSFTFAEIWRGVLTFIPNQWGIPLVTVMMFLILAFSYHEANTVFAKLKNSEAPATLSLTRPSSFLPFSHQIFIYLFLFRFAYGFMLAFGEKEGTPPLMFFAVIPLVLVALWIGVVKKGSFNPDSLFPVSVLFVIAGFLVVPLQIPEGYAWSNSLFAVGVACFNMVYWYTLMAISSQNKFNAIPILTWGVGVELLGILIGAWGGRVTNIFAHSSVALIAVSSLAAFLFIAYILFTIRKYRFMQTIEEVEEIEVVDDKNKDFSFESEAMVQSFSSWCKELAAAHGLTPREEEIFELLARGRNGRFIQDSLVLSRNTVKAHVKHIYQKLGVNSHQALIDLVDGCHEDELQEKDDGARGAQP